MIGEEVIMVQEKKTSPSENSEGRKNTWQPDFQYVRLLKKKGITWYNHRMPQMKCFISPIPD